MFDDTRGEYPRSIPQINILTISQQKKPMNRPWTTDLPWFTMTACRLGIAEGNDWPGTERRSARGSTRVEWWKVMMVNAGKYMWEIINVVKNGYTANNNRWIMDNCWISCLERHPFHRHLGMVYPINLWQYRGWFMIRFTTLTQPHSMSAMTMISSENEDSHDSHDPTCPSAGWTVTDFSQQFSNSTLLVCTLW